MPINPMTLDKIEPITIKHMEQKLINRIVHEMKETSFNSNSKNSSFTFNHGQQQQAAEKFVYFLAKYNIKLEYKLLKDRVKVKIKDKDDNLILENEVDNIEELFRNISKDTGKIIDLKG